MMLGPIWIPFYPRQSSPSSQESSSKGEATSEDLQGWEAVGKKETTQTKATLSFEKNLTIKKE